MVIVPNTITKKVKRTESSVNIGESLHITHTHQRLPRSQTTWGCMVK